MKFLVFGRKYILPNEISARLIEASILIMSLKTIRFDILITLRLTLVK